MNTPQEGMIKLSFTGDIMFNDSYARKFNQSNGSILNYSFDGLKSFFETSDFVVGNLETPVAGVEAKLSFEQYVFNAPVEFAIKLKQVGFDLVTLANNHVLDRGIKGLEATMRNLKKIDLNFTGTRLSENDMPFFIKEINGVHIGFINFTYGTNAHVNHHYLKSDEQFRINLLQSQELSNFLKRKIEQYRGPLAWLIKGISKKLKLFQMDKQVHERIEKNSKQLSQLKETIEYCRSKGADIVIACQHIGTQNREFPQPYAEFLAKKTIDFGADAVIANHEHVIQLVDEYKGKPIFYCLGNFFYDGKNNLDGDSNCSIIANLYIDPKEKRIEELGFNVIKTWDGTGNPIVKNMAEIVTDNPSDTSKTELNQAITSVLNADLADYPVQNEYFMT
jgi:poly-gamma-glutamate synthesis protein (capsule biosynthesis protein)